jgi:phosphate-selective porin OprO/OprP
LWLRRATGGYLQISWFITGEHRAYHPARGTFVQVSVPGNVFRGDGPGAWQLAARWSTLDLDDGSVAGGRLEDITVGLNWHLNTHCRMMLDGIHSRIAGTGRALIATLRIQIDY